MPAPSDPSRWVVAPTPAHEGRRLAAVAALGQLGTAPEERFDRITRLAAQLLDAPAVLLNLVDADRQWAKSACGLPRSSVVRGESLCAVVVEDDEALVVPDLAADPRLRDHPAVAAGWRAYVGLPLHDLDGHPVGTLCLLSPEPRELDGRQLELLRSLGTWAEAELNARVLGDRLVQLGDAEQHLRALLDAAPAAVLLVEGDGTVTWGSGTAADLFGDALPGRPLAEVLPSLDLTQSDHDAPDDTPAGAGRLLLEVGRDRDGAEFPAEVSAGVVPGTGVRRVVFVRDLRGDPTGRGGHSAGQRPGRRAAGHPGRVRHQQPQHRVDEGLAAGDEHQHEDEQQPRRAGPQAEPPPQAGADATRDAVVGAHQAVAGEGVADVVHGGPPVSGAAGPRLRPRWGAPVPRRLGSRP